MATFLLLLLAILTSQLVSWFLFRAARNAADFPREREGKVTMQYAPAIRMAALVLPMTALLLLVYLVSDPGHPFDSGVRTFLLWSMPVLLTAAAAITAEAHVRRIYLDDQGLCSCSVFGERCVSWDDIDSVTFNRWLKLIVVHSKDGEKLAVNPSLSGLAVFELMLFERVERHRFRSAIPAFLALQ